MPQECVHFSPPHVKPIRRGEIQHKRGDGAEGTSAHNLRAIQNREDAAMPRSTILIAATALLSAVLFAAPAQALRADVQAAVDAVERLRANDAKIQEYCAIQAEIEDAGEDENKLDAAFEKLDTFFEELGDDYAAMFAVEGELEPDSEDAKALDDAFAALDGECGA